MRAHEPCVERVGESQEGLEVPGLDALRAELDREVEIAGGGCGIARSAAALMPSSGA